MSRFDSFHKFKNRFLDKKREILVGFIFTLGLTILLFPFISNVINAKTQSYVINTYNEQTNDLTLEDIERIKEQARIYNENLHGGQVSDPFTDGNQEASVSYIDMLNVGEVMGYIEIPKIDVNLPIYHGTSDAVLRKGVGHIERSSLPIGGTGTHSVLTGHRGLPTSKLFRELDQLEVGDTFYISTLNEKLVYKVDEINIVLPNEIEKLAIENDKDLVTLITCHPYMINSHRLLVRGSRSITVPLQKFRPRKAKGQNWIYIARIPNSSISI